MMTFFFFGAKRMRKREIVSDKSSISDENEKKGNCFGHIGEKEEEREGGRERRRKVEDVDAAAADNFCFFRFNCCQFS